MKEALHTVLGATGAIGSAVIEALQRRNLQYRAVARSINVAIASNFRANLLDARETEEAVKDSEYAYLCVGLPYSTKIWERDWEVIMQNVINACSKYQAKLIFLDNIYMYAAPLPIPFDENTYQNPISNKGKVRKRVADMLLQAIKEKKIQGLIGRSADFYGNGASNSVVYISFLERIIQGKNPQLLSEGDIKHTFSYVSDIGEALVELGSSEDCYGDVWHLPVGKPTTMEEIIQIANHYMGENFKIQVMPSLMKKILPIFIPILREALEMQYQFENPYIMSDKKFMLKFPNFKVTPYEEGVIEMIKWIKASR